MCWRLVLKVWSFFQVADGLNKLYNGVEILLDGKRQLVRAMVTQYRGDWKWHRVPGQHPFDTSNLPQIHTTTIAALDQRHHYTMRLVRSGFCLQLGGVQPTCAMHAS